MPSHRTLDTSRTLYASNSRALSVSGLHVAHLHCHIGTDILSLVHLGAAAVTGLDFSPESLKEARLLAAPCRDSGGSRLRFIEGDVYDSIALLGLEQFDMVFSGIGALAWLGDISKWGRVVGGLLKPEGKLFIHEGHPVLWALDEVIPETDPVDQLRIKFPYFEIGRPIVSEGGTMSVNAPYSQCASDTNREKTFEASGTKARTCRNYPCPDQCRKEHLDGRGT